MEDDENADEEAEADLAVELEDGLAQDSAKNAKLLTESKAKAKAKASTKKVRNCLQMLLIAMHCFGGHCWIACVCGQRTKRCVDVWNPTTFPRFSDVGGVCRNPSANWRGRFLTQRQGCHVTNTPATRRFTSTIFCSRLGML